LFLKELNWVSFASGIDNAEALDRLHWGITRQKPKSPPQISAEFDVFLCYNEEDQLEVKQIAEQLRERQIQPWLDLWEALAGTSWQQLLARQIDPIKSVAVFIGNKGGPWQREEIESFIWEFIELGRPVIPVILQSTLQVPKLPIYLRHKTKVDFRDKDSDAMNQLIWGITTEKQ
ncbi:MAG: toll/interleukin-1 receptor domain-containing protein, partial [Cyanobacteriota bacterium]